MSLRVFAVIVDRERLTLKTMVQKYVVSEFVSDVLGKRQRACGTWKKSRIRELNLGFRTRITRIGQIFGVSFDTRFF